MSTTTAPRCPHCHGQNGYAMDQTIKASASGTWGQGYSELGDMSVVKEGNYRCQDCGKSVQAYIKKLGFAHH